MFHFPCRTVAALAVAAGMLPLLDASAASPLPAPAQDVAAASVEVTYDPAQVSYGELLRVFFSVAHDPTQLNRQGPDYGTQYRSAVFFTNDDQKRVAQAYIEQLGQA